MSDIPYKFIHRAVQDTCLLTEVLKRKRMNLSFYFWSDIIEEFYWRGITYDFITIITFD